MWTLAFGHHEDRTPRLGREVSMVVGQSVRHAIDDWEQRKFEAAMLHACNAIDGTAGKLYPALGNKERFTRTAFPSVLKDPQLRTESLILLT
jgi:hypothetical protein